MNTNKKTSKKKELNNSCKRISAERISDPNVAMIKKIIEKKTK